MAQRTFLMRQREDYTRFVGLCERTQQVGLVRIAHYEETRKIMLIVLNMVFEHLKSIQLSRLGMADGSPSSPTLFGNHLCRACGIVGLHILQLRMLCKKVPTLHESHRMRVDFADGIPIVVGQTADAMGDVQFMLADNRCP